MGIKFYLKNFLIINRVEHINSSNINIQIISSNINIKIISSNMNNKINSSNINNKINSSVWYD